MASVDVEVCSSNYRGTPYSTPQLNVDIHGWNRFGGTNDLVGLIAKKGSWSDYIRGLLIISIFIFSFFLSWTLVLIVFKCLGRKRVGFLSGSRFDDSLQGNRFWSPKGLRRMALLSCLLVIAVSTSIAIVNQDTFIAAVENLIDTNSYINDVARQVNNDTSHIIETSASLPKIASDLRNVTSGGLCPGKTIRSSSGENFNDLINGTIKTLDTANDILTNQLEQLRDVSQTIIDRTNTARKHLDEIQKYKWVLMAWSVPMVFFTALYLIGLIVTWVRKSNRLFDIVLSYINMPLFILFITLGWILCGIFTILAMANADACSGGPNQSPSGSVQEILKSVETDSRSSELINDVAKYYTEGCYECPLGFIDDYIKKLDEDKNQTNSFVNNFNETGIASISQQCDTRSKEDIQKIQDTFQSANSQLTTIIDDVVSVLASLLNAISCEPIHGLWADTVEDLACKQTVNTFHWGFWCWLFSSVFGLILVTIRATYLENNSS